MGIHITASARRRTRPLPELPGTSLIHDTAHRILSWAEAEVIVTPESTSSTTITLREQDDIIYDPADKTAPWKMYYSAVFPGSEDGGDEIWFISSADRVTWNAPVRCTRNGSPLIAQDPSICQTLSNRPVAYRDGGRLVMYAENPSATVNVYSSEDGVEWTLDQGSVISREATWESRLVGSPCARHDGSRYIVAYEGVETTNKVQSTGIAYGTTRTTLAKLPAPVITASGFGFSPPNQSAFIDSMWLTPAGDRIHVTGHAGHDGAVTMFRAYTTNTDPTTWQVGDFTLIGMVDAVRNDLTCDWWGDRLVAAPDDDLSLVAVSLVTP